MRLLFEVAARSIQGSRDYQEDSLMVVASHGAEVSSDVLQGRAMQLGAGLLAIVADGLGGEGGGAESSGVVANAFAAAMAERGEEPLAARLRSAVEAANDALRQAKEEKSWLRANSGSTLVAVVFEADRMIFASVGDSPLWRFRDNEIHRVNAAHVNGSDLDFRALVSGGAAAWQQARESAYRDHIVSAVTGNEMRLVQVEERRLEAGDIVILASDGIETVPDEDLRQFVPYLMREAGVGRVADGIIEAVLGLSEGRSQDNSTLIAVRYLGRKDDTVIETTA